MWIQGDVDRGQGVHSPARELVTGWKHRPHELLHEIRKAAIDNTLPGGEHQGELHEEAEGDLFRRHQAFTESMTTHQHA